MKKKGLAVLLIISMLLGISGCSAFGGKSSKKEDEPAVIYRARVTLPYSTGARAVAETEGAEALGAYLTARAYVKQLEDFDTSDPASFDANAYVDLLNRTIKALEVAEKLAADLDKNACYLDLLQRNDYVGLEGEATIKYLSPKEITGSDAGRGTKDARGFFEWLEDVFTIKAKADDDEDKKGSIAWAEKFVKQYDELPAGRALRTMAEQMGKDVRYVYAELKQAQAIIEKGASDVEADFYNKAYETAVTTKAACTTAGFVLSCIATGGTTAGLAHGIAAVNTAVNGINAVLDIGTAHSVLTTNGEGNEWTEFFEKTSSDFGIVTLIAGSFGAGAGFKDALKGDTAANVINSLLFFVGQKDYVDEKSTQLFSMAFDPGDKGITVELSSTEKGSSEAQQEAMKEVLKSGGVPSKEAEKIVEEIASKDASKDEAKTTESNGKKEEVVEDRDAKSDSKEEQDSKTPSDSPQLNPESNQSDDFPDPIEIISQYDRYTDPEGNFDVDKYISTLRSYLDDLSELEDLDPDFDTFEEDWEDYLIETYGEGYTETAEENSEESSEVQEASAEESSEAAVEESTAPEPESSAPEPESSAPEPESSTPEPEPESSAPEPEPESEPEPEPESSAPAPEPEPEPEPVAENPLSAANIAGYYILNGSLVAWGDAEGTIGFVMTLDVTVLSETSLHLSITYGAAGAAERDVTYDPATGTTSAFGMDEVVASGVFSIDGGVVRLTVSGSYEEEGSGLTFTVSGTR